LAVSVVGNQVGGVRIERHVTAVWADGGIVAIAIRIPAPCVHADPNRGPGDQVTNEDFRPGASVPSDQVGGVGPERDVPTIGADGWDEAGVVWVSSLGVHAL